jgi:predicted MPP superfamily phosphohydrolase
MPTPLTKPFTRRQLLGSLAAGLGLSFIGSLYGFAIEPRRAVADSVTFSLQGFPGALRAIHLSDIHFRGESRFMKRVADLTNSYDSDIVFLTGDLVDDSKYLPACLDWIKALHCKSGIYFVLGNWEHWIGIPTDRLISKLDSIGVKTLFNSGVRIQWMGGEFFLAGLDDPFCGLPRPKKAFRNQPDNVCTIVLCHAPIGVYMLRSERADLVLAGHTHGGQVRIPGVGAIKTPPGSGEFEQGLYRVGKSWLYVNRGIGTSVLPVRFLCPPEVTQMTIKGV